MSLFENFHISDRNGKDTMLITSQQTFIYHAGLIWNTVRNLLKMHDFSNEVSLVKSGIKRELLKIQAEGDPKELEHHTWNSLHYYAYKL